MRTTRLIIVAVGGQGNLLLSKILGQAALNSGIPMKMSEIHGMAQRGGIVESSILFGDVKSSIISDGEADILLGFEPVETLRALNRCSPDTRVIMNTATLPPFTVSIGDGVYPEIKAIEAHIQQKCRSLIAFDAMGLAKESGSSLNLNMVLLGALVENEKLGFTKEHVMEAIKQKIRPDLAKSSLGAFKFGCAAVNSG